MRLTVSAITTAQILQLEVPSSISVADLKALISAEIPTIPVAHQHLYHNGRLLSEASRSLEEYGMKNDDMVVVHARGPTASSASRSPAPATAGPSRGGAQPQQQLAPGALDPEMIRLQVLGDPNLMSELRRSNPELADAANDAERFRTVFQELERQRQEAERQKQREIQMLNEDPFNIEAQRKIEELIRQEAVMENLQSALEHHPEAFGRVSMLYIPVEVNGVSVKAFVDSGAQATIMSPSCAERCGIMRLVDSRFAGIARGVGTAKILGRVHSAQIRIGTIFLACSFTVMEGKDVDLLLGLDMLKRHQACIDLKGNCLTIQDERVNFLGESEIPKGFDGQDEVIGHEPTVEGPGGAQVGGRSGAIVQPPIGPTPAAQAPVATPAQTLPGPPRHSDETIGQLENLGFSRAEAISALDACNGDVNMAASLLFN